MKEVLTRLGKSASNCFPVKIKRILIGGLTSLTLSLLCIWAVLRFTRSGSLFANLLAVGASTLVLSLVLVAGSWVADALRLKILASAMGGQVRFMESLKITVVGSFMAGVTPFDTGGEPLKIYFLHKRGLSIGTSTAVVALGAFSHATSRFALWLLAPVIMLLTGRSLVIPAAIKATLALGIVIYLFFMFLIIAVIFWPDWVEVFAGKLLELKWVKKLVPQSMAETVLDKVRTSAYDFRDGINKVKSSGSHAVFAVLLSIAYWLLVIAVPALIVRSMVPQVSFSQVFFVAMTVYLVMAYVPTPGSSGGAEVGSAYFFASILPAKMVGVFVVVWRFATYYFTLLVGGIIALFETVNWWIRKSQSQSRQAEGTP
ncbi:MAG TPA: flippase-like domain-containing protein [Firmicutes bacterium]|nr:flippase-like domain-containing protein [Candidatus Fermentithermobacillaceae bacterium]